MECIIDGNQGIYIPQIFAKRYTGEYRNAHDAKLCEEFDILEYGPSHDLYWEAWGTMLHEFSFTDPKDGKLYHLYEDGDLFLCSQDESDLYLYGSDEEIKQAQD